MSIRNNEDNCNEWTFPHHDCANFWSLEAEREGENKTEKAFVVDQFTNHRGIGWIYCLSTVLFLVAKAAQKKSYRELK